MIQSNEQIEKDIVAYLDNHLKKSLLRFITCGSVDDGKSTLIGRLLHDSQLIYEDQLQSITRDSQKKGGEKAEVDLSLLVDGLQAEREQGITIDVAYRYFSTDKRKFIIADTPGHEQYTRNMATGASTADLAVILVDARKGVLVQTRRHSFIVSLLGIKHVVVAVNKMDLMNYSEEVFESIRADYLKFAEKLNIPDIQFIPLSAKDGDNVVDPSRNLPWYGGKTLIQMLEEVEPQIEVRSSKLFRFPVQFVNRPDHTFRGYSGTIAAGQIREGDEIVVFPSRQKSRVDRIVTFEGDLQEAGPGQAVTLTLKNEIDISRGDLIVRADEDQPFLSNALTATVVWMSEDPLVTGKQYLVKLGGDYIPVSVSRILHRVDVNTLEKQAVDRLELNEVGLCEIDLAESTGFDSYDTIKATGSMIFIDRISNITVGAAMIEHARKDDRNIVWHDFTITREERASIKGQRPRLFWFTGLSGSGKSTIANAFEGWLNQNGFHTYLLDGDNVRHGLCKDLGFSDEDRVENIRRVGEVAKLMMDAGLIVITAFISPFARDRAMVRKMFAEGDFVEVFIDTPLEVCEARDPKGLYKKARSGAIKNFTGIDSEFQRPESPEVTIETEKCNVRVAVEMLKKRL